MNKRLFAVAATLAVLTGACTDSKEKVFTVGEDSTIFGLHAPWDGLEDNTVFGCFAGEDYFYFYYDVIDPTVTLKEGFKEEKDVEPEDRVEIFFSPRPEMDIYYCAEIDPEGRVLDYSSKYYREMDYGWNFSTMDLFSKITEKGYLIAGRVSKEELRSLGLDLEGGFSMGVFRADFREDGTVNWYSAIPSDDKAPDFHKPDMLFRAKMP